MNILLEPSRKVMDTEHVGSSIFTPSAAATSRHDSVEYYVAHHSLLMFELLRPHVDPLDIQLYRAVRNMYMLRCRDALLPFLA